MLRGMQEALPREEDDTRALAAVVSAVTSGRARLSEARSGFSSPEDCGPSPR